MTGGRAMTTLRNSRAAAVAVAVIQITKTAPRQKRQQQVEQYLRDEFEDERRQALADRELADA
jgi:adenosylmethionine-8-amino-7-oxononanoate aminotransferase